MMLLGEREDESVGKRGKASFSSYTKPPTTILPASEMERQSAMTMREPVGTTCRTTLRYSVSPLPPYRHVPGQTPHPVSDPAGHSHGQSVETPEPLTEANWRSHETWLYAADLFNHSYYWEAHEAWESLWHAAGRRGPEADLFKGLIKLAATGVKQYEQRPAGVRRHAVRAAELLAPLVGEERFGLSVGNVHRAAAEIAAAGTVAGDRIPLVLVLNFADA